MVDTIHTQLMPRAAVVKGGARTRQEVDAYLPNNYTTIVVESYPAHGASGCVEDDGRMVQIAIVGMDSAGWTLDDYVIPRLASGLIWAEEVTADGD